MAINSIIHTNRHSIDRVLNAGVPVLLVFAEGAHPTSSAVDAALDEAARAHAGKLLVARIDTAQEAELVKRFQILGLPAIVPVVQGRSVETVSAPDAERVRAWVRHLVEGGPRPSAPKAASIPPAGQPHTLTDATFAAAIAGPLPVLIDFWAPWCGPCRMIAPSVERLAQEYAGRAVVAKMNVDENPMTPGQFGIRGIPALLIFKNGQVVDQIVGAQPYTVLQQRLARHAP